MMPAKCKHLLIIILVALLSFCPGCWDYREIEQSSIPSAVGVDLQEDGLLSFSTLLVQPLPPGEAGSSDVQPVLVTSNGQGVALAARKNMLSLSKVPEWAHVRAIILGENLVKNDLSQASDFMTRNRNLRPDISLFISSGTTPEEILAAQFPQTNDLGSGLQSMVKLNQDQLGIYVPTTMEEFTYRLATPGIEPLVPQVTLTDAPSAGNVSDSQTDTNGSQTNNKKKQISLSGAAAFKGRKMAGSLNETECRGYRWLSPTSTEGGLFIIPSPLNPEEDITMEIVVFGTQSRPEIVEGQIKIRIKVEAQLNFYEESGAAPVLEPELAGQIEAAATREIERQIKSCISRSQELGSDFLGWGRLVYEYQPSEWEQVQSEWPNLFPDVKYSLQIKTVLKRNGMTSKSFQFK
ncbi:MAG: Ger(x)C family spore germination protein [Syntrophomonadaceae bacterium]